jgi:hypothetical protein
MVMKIKVLRFHPALGISCGAAIGGAAGFASRAKRIVDRRQMQFLKEIADATNGRA